MYGFKIRIKGDYALFSRPEMKVERVSYDLPTPGALVGLISAIYWHPGVRYVIDKIYVYRPINFVNIRRNELSEKISLRSVRAEMEGKGSAAVSSADLRTQRASMLTGEDNDDCRTPRGVRGLKSRFSSRNQSFQMSHPARGARIEMKGLSRGLARQTVAPREGCAD